MLKTAKAKLVGVAPQQIESIDLPSDTKLVLAAIATGGVFET
jgi:guanyl-specific ribonuclease Sa